MVTIPASANSNFRSLDRTSAVSIPNRSSRSRAPSNNAPRGTAIVKPGVMADSRALPAASCQLPTPESLQPLLGSLRQVDPLHIQADATSRQRPPKAADQIVVAAPAPEREADGRVVQLEHGAGV